MKKLIGSIVGFFKKVFSNTKTTIVAVLVIFVVVIIVSGTASNLKEEKEKKEALARAEEYAKQQEENTLIEDAEDGRNDSYLLSIQEDLKASYGELPEGYLWDVDGSILSTGNVDMSAEDTVFAYLNGLRTLDLSSAQKYSRNSMVVNTYKGYFDSQDLSTNYYDSFIRNMYKEMLLSIQVLEIVDTTVFAENKQVFTVKLSLIDLSYKDFWLEDREEIYNNLYIYSNDENDSTKGEMYLYDYILNYYRSDSVVEKTILINITTEKYPDLNTGWLVSIDKDLNDACIYTDGNLMINYINRLYSEEGRSYVEEKRGGVE